MSREMGDVIENLSQLRFYLLLRKIELEIQLREECRRFRIVGINDAIAKLSEVKSIIALIKKEES